MYQVEPQQMSLQVFQIINICGRCVRLDILFGLLQPKAHEGRACRGALRTFLGTLSVSSSRRAARSQ